MATSASTSGDKTPHTTQREHQSDAERTQRRQTYQSRRSELRDKVLSIAGSLRVALPSDSLGSSRSEHASSSTSPKPPRFGDLSPYLVKDDNEKYLWELEVSRLIDSLEAAQEPLSISHRDALPSAIDTSGFTRLERLSDQMLCALSIYGLDDNVATAVSPDESIGGRSFKKLEERLGARPEAIQVGRARYARASKNDSVPEGDRSEVQRNSMPVAPLDDNDAPTYYVLVDYISTTLARLLLAGSDDHQVYWLSIVITTLAKFSTKLKVLSHDLFTFGKQSLGRFSEHRRKYMHVMHDSDNPQINLDLRKAIQEDAAGINDSYVATYVSDMAAVSNWLFRLMWHILTDLNTRTTRGRATDEFEISATVFMTGSRSLPTLAYQNRLGHISGSSSATAVGMHKRAFQLMTDTITFIEKKSIQGTQIARCRSTLSIGVGQSFPSKKPLEIRSMADIVSIMVVLSCMDPSLTEDMVKVCGTVRASTVLPGVHSTVEGYAAFVSLHNVPAQLNLQRLNNSRPLSQSFMLHSGNRVLSELSDRDNTSSRWNFAAATRKELYKSETMRRQISASASGWAVEEQAISVSCLRYTISVMTGCAILVLGGLMAGFFVGSRIDGVDPFNLTMFAWIIAGFIILVSKSLRVGEWTWRDFLKGRVTCRSVHELASVTNLDEQGIIMQLLSSEKEWPLILRGPYNSAFSNTGAEGFSIDVKPKISTLFVSGLLVLEVLMESGSALVCLDLRPQVTAGEDDDVAGRGDIAVRMAHTGRKRMVHGQYSPFLALACKDVPHQGEAEKDIVFRQQWVSWEKVIGLYNNPNQSVR